MQQIFQMNFLLRPTNLASVVDLLIWNDVASQGSQIGLPRPT